MVSLLWICVNHDCYEDLYHDGHLPQDIHTFIFKKSSFLCQQIESADDARPDRGVPRHRLAASDRLLEEARGHVQQSAWLVSIALLLAKKKKKTKKKQTKQQQKTSSVLVHLVSGVTQFIEHVGVTVVSM